MKTKLFLIAVALLSLNHCFAQDGAYQKAMGEALVKLSKAESPDDLMSVSNAFDRIAMQKEGDLWSNYYAALAKIRSSFSIQDVAKRDALLDGVLKDLSAVQEHHPNNSELEVLRGYALMSKMVIDPASRGQQYSPMVAQSYGKAIAMDQENPRAMAMMARWELGTAQFFGSETTKPCGMAQQSLKLFEKDQPSGFEPGWGQDIAQEVLAACAQ